MLLEKNKKLGALVRVLQNEGAEREAREMVTWSFRPKRRNVGMIACPQISEKIASLRTWDRRREG